ncbi:thiamine-phosphate diphosphorylase [candidate division WOR-1 bacterium RIFOXYA2_FULL_36_21]|uniref:Thiamine-phosphate synthase n=1 Tax=candidate division WOR-1 bacterium RIFOXYB2_FULL_36_35 TaxID=1802578 RepID=A0A1F4S6P9_UNCSA|nr:MAG: thiamine-phosphate diphosphorylase [candidate division WOR-1 bacterium RIFOXYA2_FULL_36_21]OGC15413.1 MAG: thiamine-phosphate diphosphorylase [candidate division WOR-1 bacterium RIFOXYB2_FULL_36_35]OGC21127.1 MAG: thiamine-phosphate diphosphorylase [candidate division WOR-1 bacterium RIFOXYA12_FULL_36_13]
MGIYPVISPDFCAEKDPIFILQEILKGGAKIVQLRDKKNPEQYVLEFRKLTNKYNALLIINDSVDIALKYNADGVHLGQEDMPLIDARKIAPNLLIGVSTHNLKEALFAQENGASYVNIGPIFPTKTKDKLSGFLGVTAIKEISSHLIIPFTVMGGINKNNIDQILESGAKKIAMVTGITHAYDIKKTVKTLIEKIKP